MASDLKSLLKLDVPVIVLLGTKRLSVKEVTSLMTGAIIELPKRADDELELMVNNKVVGTGSAVKVGENFGIRIAFIGDVRTRVAALGAADAPSDEVETALPAGHIGAPVAADIAA